MTVALPQTQTRGGARRTLKAITQIIFHLKKQGGKKVKSYDNVFFSQRQKAVSTPQPLKSGKGKKNSET